VPRAVRDSPDGKGQDYNVISFHLIAVRHFFHHAGVINKQKIKMKNKLIKSTLVLSAFTILAVLTWVGCSQNSSNSSTDTQSTNSSMSDTNGAVDATTNTPATNNLADSNTNIPASTNQ